VAEVLLLQEFIIWSKVKVQAADIPVSLFAKVFSSIEISKVSMRSNVDPG
jgi:hypothetical protein